MKRETEMRKASRAHTQGSSQVSLIIPVHKNLHNDLIYWNEEGKDQLISIQRKTTMFNMTEKC